MTNSHWRAERAGIPLEHVLTFDLTPFDLDSSPLGRAVSKLFLSYVTIPAGVIRKLYQIDNCNFAHFDAWVYTIPNHFILGEVYALG